MRYLIFLILLLVLPLQAATLKIATLAPDGSHWMQALRSAADNIKRQSQGRLQLRFYPGGVMGNDQSVMRKMRIGQLQGAMLTAGGIAQVAPESQIYSLPFLFRDYAEVDRVRREMDKEVLNSLKRHQLISFGISEVGFAYLMSQEPIPDIATLKRQKVWAPQGDSISQSAFEAVEITPVPLPLGDVLTGLETGLVNTVSTSPLGAIALQWHSRVRYLTDIPLIYLYGAVVFNKRSIDRLPEQDRQLLQQVMADTARTIGDRSRRDNQEARQALAAQGIRFITPDISQMSQWRTSVDRAMQRLAASGQLDRGALKKLQQILDTYRNGSR